MPTPTETRKRQFRAALALAGMSGEQFATKFGVTKQHLWAVVSGDRESQVLMEQVEKFTKKHLVSMNALVA